MEQGNEGDEIIFLTIRQIGCAVPDSVQKVGDITPELLIEIISRALFLISKGEIQCPTTLPNNIAARHRICTDVALKIKELGYPSDCGYNQLLYPIEHHTRDLLKYIVFKVPRTQEEGSEELVGANAILNRNIHRSLQQWKAALWRLPCCLEGRPLTNIYKTKPFQSSAADRSQHLAARLVAQHLAQKSQETVRTEQLNRKFLAKQKSSSSTAASAADAADLKALEQAAFLQQRVQAALQTAVHTRASPATDPASLAEPSQLAEAKEGEEEGVDAVSRARTQEDKMAQQMAYSLQELVHHIAHSKAAGSSTASSSTSSASADGQLPQGGHTSSSSSSLRETRFAHATQFAQEDPSSLAGGVRPAAVPGTSTAASMPGEATGPAGKDVYQSTYQSVFQATLTAGLAASSQAAMQARQAALTAALAQVKGDLQERKRLLEQEEAQRAEELRWTRESIEEYALRVDQQAREEEALAATVAALEEEVARLHADTDKLEKDCVVKRQALELVPSASENILRLQEVCDKGAQKLRLLEEEWDAVQAPLIEELAVKERRKAARLNRVATLLEEMERYRELMAPMVADLQEKQQRAEMLHEETAKLNKNLNRALYTHRILDITQSIAKQNKEIQKITGDIRDLQKTINLNSSTLSRADAITEELIFKAASDTSDAVMVDTYRRLKVLRSTFENLLNTLSEIGLIEKSHRDLETKIEVEKGRVASMNYDRINADLQAILAENQKLLADVKALANRK